MNKSCRNSDTVRRFPWYRLSVTLLLAVLGLGLFGQTRQITGSVYDANTGEAIPGASVYIQGTTIGTVSDQDGRFTLSVTANDKTMSVSFIGYRTQEVPLDGNSSLTVRLEPTDLMMDDIVVMAYSVQKKSSITGSVGLVKADRLDKIQSSSSSQALQGMIAGVQVRNNIGAPGAEAQILIRGIGSYGASNEPLYVVDGVAYEGGLSTISPNDIESISILKDAASTSLYGSRAANGVVVVSTKTGKSQKPVVNFTSKFGTSHLAVPMPKRATGQELLELTWEARYLDATRGVGMAPMDDAAARAYASAHVLDFWYRSFTDEDGVYYISKYTNPDGSPAMQPIGTDGKMKPGLVDAWEDGGNWDDLFTKKLRQEYNVDLSGMASDGKTKYFLSGSYLSDPSSYLIQKFNRWSGRANVSSAINKWLEVGLNLSYTQSARDLSTYSGGVRVARIMPELYTPWTRNIDNSDYVYTVNGNKIPDMGTYRTIWAGYNPMANLGTKSNNPDNATFSYRDESNVSGMAFLQLNLAKGLKFKTNGSYEVITRNNQSFWSNTYGLETVLSYIQGTGELKAPSGNSAQKDTWQRKVYTINNLLTYQKTLGTSHNLNFLAGQESHSWYENWFGAYGDGIMVEGLYEVNNVTRNKDAWGGENGYRLLSFFGEARYDFNEKYFLTGSVRTDGSSRFSPENRWGKFWAASALWAISSEDFMSGTSGWLNDLKLKASIGTTGNDRVSYYAYQGLYGLGDFNGSGTASLSRYPTPSLLWEKNIQFNTALSFRLFKTLSGEIEYFDRTSDDLIFSRSLPPSTGWFGGIEQNVGKMRNNGVEVSLSKPIISTSNLTWTIDANFTYLKNTMVSLPDGDIYYTDGVGNFRITEGKSRYEIWMVGFAGIDPEDGRSWYWKKNFQTDGEGAIVYDEKGAPVIESWEKTKDYNSVNNDLQRDWKGSTLPWGYGAVTNTLKYRDFDFSFMFYYSLGGKMIDQMYREAVNFRGGFGLASELIEDRWTPENPNGSTVGRYSVNDQANIIRISDQIIFDNTFVRLRNVSAGYNMPERVLNRIGLTKARVFVSADNLITFGKAAKRGTDPEININGVAQDGNVGYAVDDQWGPRKVFITGIQVSF